MLFCFGIGYSAEVFLHRLTASGIPCAGTTRDPSKRKRLQAAGINAVAFDDMRVSAMLAQSNALLSSIPPDDGGDPVLLRYSDAIPPLPWIGYLSTTGVYGDHQGGWVDESTPTQSTEDRLLRRIEAEQAWLVRHPAAHIFRLSGIYGPGRSTIDQLRNGTARRIDKPGQYFSRIHVEDIAETLWQSLHHPASGNIYNVCDDEPAPSQEVVAYAAQLLNMPPPPLIPYEQADLSHMARGFYLQNRRVSNRKLREVLRVVLHYPTYREGLRAIVA